MAVDVVEDIRLLEIIHLLGLADPPGHGKAPRREMGEEDFVGDEAGHRHDLPARRLGQGLAQALEAGDALLGDAEARQPVEKLVTGTALKRLRLALEETAPDRMVGRRIALDRLVHGVVGADSSRIAWASMASSGGSSLSQV
jgi:hypothetical protein